MRDANGIAQHMSYYLRNFLLGEYVLQPLDVVRDFDPTD